MVLREVTLLDERSLQEIADALAGSHKILLVTGAGISTSCGIPDFRSKDGLYNMIPSQNMLPTPPPSQPSTPTINRVISQSLDDELSSSQSRSRRASSSPSSRLRGQNLFDSRVFQNPESTTVFYQFIASLRQKIRDEVHSTSSVHKFVRVLREGGRLMRCYTQNIDGLEAREGLVTDMSRGKGNKRRFMKKHFEAPRPVHTQGTDFDGGCEVVQLHGDLDKLRCTMCSTQYEWRDEETEVYLEGAAPSCPKCKQKSEERQATGKRGLAVGSLRPNIVLYGEDHPSNTQLTPLIPFDSSCVPEVLVIMGTSLKVFGLQKIVREFAKAVHSNKNGKGRVIFVNRTRPAESTWDGIIDDFVAMDCDDWVEDLKRRRHDLWLRQGEIDLSATKSVQPKRKRKSVDDDLEKENKPIKKAKIVVEISSSQSKTGDKTQGRLARKMKTPKRPKPIQDYPGRAILSPLAQPRRPPPSPFTSPIGGDDDVNTMRLRKLKASQRPPISPFSSPIYPERQSEFSGRRKRGTPLAPAFSPLTPGFRSGSKLKEMIFQDDDMENLPSSPYVSDSDPEPQPAEEKEAITAVPPINGLGDSSEQAIKQPGAPSWWLGGPGRLSFLGRVPTSSQRSAEDTDEVDTPSRGPGGRKKDVFAKRSVLSASI